MSVAIEGLWKVCEVVRAGQVERRHPASHYLFSGDRLRRFWYPETSAGHRAHETDEGPYQVIAGADHAALDFTPDGASKAIRWLVRVAGEELAICFGPRGALPREFSSDKEAVVRLRRDAVAVPPVADHPYFGRVGYHVVLESWRCTIDVDGRAVEVSFDGDASGDPARALAIAQEVFGDLAAWRERTESFAVEKLLPMKNEGWLLEDEAPVTAEAFRGCMSLPKLHVDRRGHLTFEYEVGELFWEHAIHVYGTLEGGPDDAAPVG